MRERDYLEDTNVDSMIIIKWIITNLFGTNVLKLVTHSQAVNLIIIIIIIIINYLI